MKGLKLLIITLILATLLMNIVAAQYGKQRKSIQDDPIGPDILRAQPVDSFVSGYARAPGLEGDRTFFNFLFRAYHYFGFR